jgi:hypothetical protein
LRLLLLSIRKEGLEEKESKDGYANCSGSSESLRRISATHHIEGLQRC